MGYYSNLAIDAGPQIYDPSYTSPEQQLLWRLDDLRDRLEDLPFLSKEKVERFIFTENELRYAPVRSLETLLDVNMAIQIAINDLKDKYGINVAEDGVFASKENTLEQLSWFNNAPICCDNLLRQAA